MWFITAHPKIIMLARLLRAIYLIQLLCGALLGSYLAVQLTNRCTGMIAVLLVTVGALGLPVLLQFLTILTLMIISRTGSSWPLWWRALWSEFKATMLIFILRQPWPDRQNGILLPSARSPTQPRASALPTLLVHGYLCNHRVWDNMTLALRDAGHPVLRVDLEPLFTSIDDYVATLEQGINTLLSETQARQVVLVGHSMGGLAIRAWLRKHGPERVARIITLGTPHHGTHIAHASMTTNGTQMACQSDWLQALSASEDDTKRALMHLAITAQDNVVFPQAEQILPGAQVTHFQGIGHLQMCLDPTVIYWVCQQADTPPTHS